MLSPSAILEIRNELDRLRTIQAKVAERIAALEAIQQPFDWSQGSLPLVPKNGGEVQYRVTIPASPKGNSPFASTGLRAAILDALKAGPMKAPQVARVLMERGFLNDSPTPLSTRVYNDLWRMSQKGIVESKDGAFSVK